MSCAFRRLVNPINRIVVRHAGGGGRPGGRPAFNWKEKKQLGIGTTQLLKPWKDTPFGDVEVSSIACVNVFIFNSSFLPMSLAAILIFFSYLHLCVILNFSTPVGYYAVF